MDEKPEGRHTPPRRDNERESASDDDGDGRASGDAKAAGSDSPHLDAGEKDQAADHAAPHALVIHEIVRQEGEEALARDSGALLWSALAAGLSMGFSFLTMAIVRGALPDAPWTRLIDSFGYSVGFVIVVLGRQQLFTESTLTVVLPLLTRRDLPTLQSALRVWALVLLANLVGTAIFAGLLTVPGLFEKQVTDALGAISEEVMSASAGITLLKAVLSGWLIALMVWLLPSARSARLLIVLLITYVVAVTKLTHVVAGSVEAAYGVFTGQASAGDYLFHCLLPTFIGNVIGGMSLVGLLNHAAIAAEIHEPVR